MTKLAWNAVGERFFETGIDRGVLYVDGTSAAWPGLISVSESPSGGEARPFYVDGVKYLNLSSAEEFEGSITAFSSPAAFAPCEGVVAIHTGLFATQQPKKSFSMSYRTKVGNDIDATDHAYKIHLVYNALASSPKRSYSTVTESVEPEKLSWDITTLPPAVTGLRPTAHFIIDSRTSSSANLTELENALYGTSSTNPYLPTVQQLLSIFSV